METAIIKKSYHLNCCTNMPKGGRFINEQSPAKVCCHCLLIETDQGLILFDTGIGIDDMADPSRTGPLHLVNRPRQDVGETAFHQIKNLGLDPLDVKHIIMSHLDLDHTGGLPDFPNARIHVYADEFEAAMRQQSIKEKVRYRDIHWAHSPDWEIHQLKGDEPWYGFDSIRNLNGLPSEIVYVVLPGHTKGHCGIAVKRESSWLLYAADAYFYHKELGQNPTSTPGMLLFQLFAHTNHKEAAITKKRIRSLVINNSDEVSLFSSHDRYEFEQLSGTAIK